jgi:DNA-directed RNA polymerase specialized sigma24 family protein
MSAVVLEGNREDLFREISNILQKWPEIEREVFARAHYRGLSRETISDSLRLDVDEVGSILKKCDRKLLNSLKEFRRNTGSKGTYIPTASSPAA